jgi:Ribonucleotide reductase, alpha subunit
MSQTTAATESTAVPQHLAHPEVDTQQQVALGDFSDYKIIRRNGAVVGFEPSKIAVAMTKAFLAVQGGQGAASASMRETVSALTENVVRALLRSRPSGGTFHIEDIQDQVELSLMRTGQHEVARAYVLYRERRSQERAKQKAAVSEQESGPVLHVLDGGLRKPLDQAALVSLIESACAHLSADVKAAPIVAETLRNLYDGVPMLEVYKASILASRTLIERDPDYSKVTARLLLHTMRRETLNEDIPQEQMTQRYAEYFPRCIKEGVELELLDERLGQFDLARLGAALKAERDLQFDYLGLQTLYDRYFLANRADTRVNKDGRRIELPQAFFMRVAMGLSLNEIDREARAIEFYELLSSFDFMSSTPTLFNAGTRRSQLSSCYLTTVADDLDGIYEAIKENALLSKFAGGLGNDWTRVRALGSHIKGTNGKSQGVVPFLKVVNDTAVAVNQGGKRKGAVCAYLETWHLESKSSWNCARTPATIAAATHDMNTANWVPDLFMKRVMEGGDWTLFSPADVPDLHDKFGKDFEQAYTRYEQKAALGELKLFKTLPRCNCGARCCRCCSKPAIPGSPSRMRAMCAARSSMWAWCIRATSAPRSRSTPTRAKSRCAISARSTCCASERRADGCQGHRPGQAQAHHPDRDAYARQRDRHQLLRRGQGAQRQYEAPASGSGHHGLSGLSVSAAHSLWFATSRGICRSVDGSGLLRGLLGVERTGTERGRYSSYGGSLWDQGILPMDSLKLLAEQRGGYVEADTSSTLTGTPCARRSRSTACAIPTAWPSPPRPPSPTSSASTPASSRPSRTCTSSPICRASSPSSINIWCATSRRVACGTQ